MYQSVSEDSRKQIENMWNTKLSRIYKKQFSSSTWIFLYILINCDEFIHQTKLPVSHFSCETILITRNVLFPAVLYFSHVARFSHVLTQLILGRFLTLSQTPQSNYLQEFIFLFHFKHILHFMPSASEISSNLESFFQCCRVFALGNNMLVLFSN